MPITYVQGATRDNYFIYISDMTFASTPTEGCLIVVDIRISNPGSALVGVTDNYGNTYHHAVTNNEPGYAYYLYYAYQCATGPSHTIYVEQTEQMSWIMGIIREFAGLQGAADPLADADSGYAANTDAPYDFSVGTVTPTAAGDLVVMGNTRGAVGYDTEPGNVSCSGNYWDSWYSVVGSPAPFDAQGSFTAASGYHGVVAVFKANSDVWVDIPNWHAHEWIASAQYPGGVARCLCDLWTEDTGSPLPTIIARLVSLLADGSVDAEVGRSATISAASPTDATFSVTLTGNKMHKLQVTSDTPGIDLWCAPGAKVVP